MTALLELEGVRKHFGKRRLLDIGHVAFDAGRAYVLTGDNGTGKSTLLRIVAGLEPAAIDAYRFRGESVDPRRLPDFIRRDVIYTHQLPYLFQTSVVENVAYGLKIRGVSRRAAVARTGEALRWAGIEHLNGTSPVKLSGGERQRVALARTWALRPSVYLLDEPTASLDADGRRQVVDLIARLCEGENCVVVACHDRELIDLPHVARLHLAAGQLHRDPPLRSQSTHAVAVNPAGPADRSPQPPAACSKGASRSSSGRLHPEPG